MQSDEEMVGTGEPIFRIIEAATGEARYVYLTWENGQRVVVDLTPLIAIHKAFARLRVDDDFFRTMQIGEWGWDLEWPGEPYCAIPAAYLQEFAAPI